MSRLPLIGATAGSLKPGLDAYHISGDLCVRAVAIVAKGRPAILPSRSEQRNPPDIIDGLDGSLFTVCLSNIEPFNVCGLACVYGRAHDSARRGAQHSATPMRPNA